MPVQLRNLRTMTATAARRENLQSDSRFFLLQSGSGFGLRGFSGVVGAPEAEWVAGEIDQAVAWGVFG